MASNPLLELALEGERLCKSCDFEGGIKYFEAALNHDTNDKRTLSAIYSQIGNAYFYLSNFEKALESHNEDLKLAVSMKDVMGEAKASGNLGNTLKMLGRFDEAAMYCNRHLDIARSLKDKVGEGRALYNLGNVYHTMGKHLAASSLQDPGDFPEEVKSCFRKAVEYYEKNLELMLQIGDKSAQGRAYGNLGNSHYLLGNFDQAVTYHKERLRIAREFGDKAAERRAHCNLGNAHIFLGDFEKAIHNFKQTLILARELGDRVIEAQACYSLGNTYTLLRDFKKAIDYHLKHLQIARDLCDKIDEGRAYWSLGNALSSVSNHKEALNYALKHLEISTRIGDRVGQETATKSIKDLNTLIVQEKNSSNINDIQPNKSNFVNIVNCNNNFSNQTNRKHHEVVKTPVKKASKRFSMENMDILKLTPKIRAGPERKNNNFSTNNIINNNNQPLHRDPSFINQEDDYFLDLLAKYQSKRMDDQRCVFDPSNKENMGPDPMKSSSSSSVSVSTSSSNRNNRSSGGALHRSTSHPAHPVHNTNNPNSHSDQHSTHNTRRSSNPHMDGRSLPRSTSQSSTGSGVENAENAHHRDELFDLIEGMQSRRMEEQRATFPVLRRSMTTTNGPETFPAPHRELDSRPATIQENSELSIRNPVQVEPVPVEPRTVRTNPRSRQMSLGANVLPDEDFFEQLIRCQGSRLEDQRSALPPQPTSNGGPPGMSAASLQGPRAPINLPHNRNNNNNNNPLVDNNNAHARLNHPRPPSMNGPGPSSARGPTLPDEEFLSLIMRFQSARIEDQRSTLPPNSNHPPPRPRDSPPSSPGSSRRSSTSCTEDGKKCSKV